MNIPFVLLTKIITHLNIEIREYSVVISSVILYR